jgi:hypothetical protein
MNYSKEKRDELFYSIKNVLDECINDGKKVKYTSSVLGTGWYILINIKDTIKFNIYFSKNMHGRHMSDSEEHVSIYCKFCFSDKLVIKNDLIINKDAKLANILIKEILYIISFMNTNEDYDTLAYTILKRLTKLEIEYTTKLELEKDNSDNIDEDIDYNLIIDIPERQYFSKKGDDK